MVTALIVTLSIASRAVEVPYVPQTDALCGGAAAAMVFRYWGDTHADVQQFAPFVDHRAGGIAADVLVRAIEQRGWRAERFDGSIDQLADHLAARQPVIVLLGDRGSRYHYVVVTAVEDGRVIVHDPSRGPSRPLDVSKFVRLWQRSHFWSLVILPTPEIQTTRTVGDRSRRETSARVDEVSTASDPCERLLDRTVATINRQAEENGVNDASHLEVAEGLLRQVRDQCPGSAGPLRELAGVKFAQKRWFAAVALAEEALKRDPADAYTLDLLGASLFMEDDTAGALRAWNRIDKPTLDVVHIEGIRRARYQTIVEALDLRPNTLLTPEALAQARRRLGELPDRTAARLAVRPDADGFAAVDIALAEQMALPRSWPEMAGVLVRAGVDREASASLPGFTGAGEVWSASWRWWNNRPRAALSFAAPRPAGLFGIWRVDASWEAQTYSSPAFTASSLVRESRTHGGLSVSDWLTGNVRYEMSVGLDAWSAGGRSAFVGASIERRSPADRVLLSADATAWMPTAREPRFGVVGARAVARSSRDPRDWRLQAEFGADYAAEYAPLALWPGAGEGRARDPLLRAHPLLADGVLTVAQQTVFGRTLAYSNIEVQRWIGVPSTVLGIAAFVDAGRASRRLAPGVAAQVDVGIGLRVRVPGINRILRIDAAHGLRDGANALTAGWLF